MKNEKKNVSPHCRSLMQMTKLKRTSKMMKSSMIHKNNEIITKKNEFDDFFEFFLEHFDQITFFSQSTNSATSQKTEKTEKNTIMIMQSDTAANSDFENTEIKKKNENTIMKNQYEKKEFDEIESKKNEKKK